jgi:hypothetical protein
VNSEGSSELCSFASSDEINLDLGRSLRIWR